MNQYAQPPQVVVKQSSGCKTALIVVAILALIALLLVGGCFAVGMFTVAEVSKQIKEEEKLKKEISSKIRVSEFTWKSGGSGIMLVSFILKNNNTFDVKDIEIGLLHYAASGTVIDEDEHKIYEVIRAGEERKFTDINIGFVNNSRQETEMKVIGATEVSN